MKTKLLLALTLVGVAGGEPPASPNPMISPTTPDKSYMPGVYGRVKDASMFICWREWDGEIRLGGVAKSLSAPFMHGDSPAAENFFSVESSGSNGTANKEHLLLSSDETTLLEFKKNYQGRIVVHNEPTVTKKPDGTWEITFAGQKTDQPARAVDLIQVADVPAHSNRTESPLKPSEIAVLPAEALGVPLTTIWGEDVRPTNSTHYHFILFTAASGKRYEAGLRSDGVVVWRVSK